MQKDKTIMIVGSMIDHNIYRSSYLGEFKGIWPFYLQLLPEHHPFPLVGNSLNLYIGKRCARKQLLAAKDLGKFTNQDRSFHGRLRLWKEGRWKQWTPQIVLGANDLGCHENSGGGNITFDNVDENINHLTRFYLAVTKHSLSCNVGHRAYTPL